MTIYFTSDTHFGHAKILEYCKRPFKDLDEMNEEMVRRWNSRVKPEDTVYHLGDFFMGPKTNVSWRKRLNGRVILIRGNHDRSKTFMLDGGFDEVHTSQLLEIDGKRVYLAHIPNHLPDPTERQYPSELIVKPPEHDLFLCGHVHNQWARRGNTINVGVDVSNFYPLTFEELLSRD